MAENVKATGRESGIRRQTVDLLLLNHLLQHGEKCGWELAITAEKYAAWPEAAGTVLPLLWRMQRQGLVQARWVAVEARWRKQYQLTESGLTAYQKGIWELEMMLRELRLTGDSDIET